METAKCKNFGWETLLGHIKANRVIPVIGKALYWVKLEGKDERLLYDYLAEQVLQKCRPIAKTNEDNNFARACFEFLQKNNQNYWELSDFLKEKLGQIMLREPNSLTKLAMIKGFNFFINTSYDDFLAEAINKVRGGSLKKISKGLGESVRFRMDNTLFTNSMNSADTVIYQFFGSLYENPLLPFTERDLRGTITDFHREMGSRAISGRLLSILRESSFLFIGCAFGGLLLRNFIHYFSTIQRPPICSPIHIYIGGTLNNDSEKSSYNEYDNFFKSYGVQVIDSCEPENFVDCLLERFMKKYPQDVIPYMDYNVFAVDRFLPCRSKKIPEKVETPVAFISFHGKNRGVALKLAAHLKEDGINVWLDKDKLEPGDSIYETIMGWIDKCPVFLPLISEESKNLAEIKSTRFHCQEWDKAYSNMKLGLNPKKIIPVKIDDTKWIYKHFEDLYTIEIPGGERAGDYERLKAKLLEIQNQRKNKGYD